MSTETLPIPAPEAAPQGNPARPLGITANLLPDEIVDARRARRVRGLVVVGLVAVVLLLAGWYALAVDKHSAAVDDRDKAQDAVTAVHRQQNEYSELTSVRADLSTVTGHLATLMADDLQWKALIREVRGAAPAGVKISSLTGGVGGDTVAQGTQRLPSETAEQLVGALTVTGTAGDKDQIAEFVDNLREITGLANPIPASVTADNGTERYSITLDVTAAALGGRFATATPSASSTGEAN